MSGVSSVDFARRFFARHGRLPRSPAVLSQMDMDALIRMGGRDPDLFMRAPLVRLYLATQPGWLYTLPSLTLQAIILSDTACPAKLLDRLSRDRGLPILARAAAAARADLSPEMLRRFMRHASAVRLEIARNRSMPLDLEAPLSRDKSAPVRAAIARRTKNPEILSRLSRDPSLHQVRVSVARNPNTPSADQAYLSQSKLRSIQDALVEAAAKFLPGTTP